MDQEFDEVLPIGVARARNQLRLPGAFKCSVCCPDADVQALRNARICSALRVKRAVQRNEKILRLEHTGTVEILDSRIKNSFQIGKILGRI